MYALLSGGLVHCVFAVVFRGANFRKQSIPPPPTNQWCKHPAQVQRLTRLLKFCMWQVPLFYHPESDLKPLTRLCGCADWSALWLFACSKIGFSHNKPHFSYIFQFHCCGVDSYTEFETATKWNRTFSDGSQMKIPPSCCMIKNEDDFYKNPGDAQLKETDCPINPTDGNSYQNKVQHTMIVLTLNAPIATKVVCFSRLLKCLRSLYSKKCGPRSELFSVHAACFYT